MPPKTLSEKFRDWFEDTIGLDTIEKQNTFVNCRNEIEKLTKPLKS